MRISYLILALLVFQGCQSTESKISKLWIYTHYSGKTDSQKNHFSPASFLLLQSNGVFTKDFGRFEYGHWELVNDKLILSQRGEMARFQISTDGHDLRIMIENGNPVNFQSVSVNATDEGENPFSVQNNQWRIKASAKENDSQIVSRLKNHFQF